MFKQKIPDFVQNPEQTTTKEIEIEKESTPTETLVPKSPVRKTHTGESSKIKNPPIQEKMVAMLEAVHKLIE